MVYQQIGQVVARLPWEVVGAVQSRVLPSAIKMVPTASMLAVLGVRGVTSPRDPRARHHCCSGDGGHTLHPLGHDDQWDFNLLTL